MEYKRLTERRGSLVIDKCGNCENVSNPQGCIESMCYEVMKNRLAELEDKIEQGTLIELPCKVGDTVYWVWEEYTNGKQKLSIEEWEVEKICIEKNEWAVKGLGEELVEGVRQFFWCHSSKFGIWWFLTREEAEKRMLELQGDK
jgi:hypothetical protein